MIIKSESAPYNLLGLEALERRLSSTRSDDINLKERIRTAKAGINGEKIMHDIFTKYKLTFEHSIFHGLNLTSTGKFQIDNLFLSRQGAFILEVKNIRGSISFPEQSRQLIRTLEDGKMEAFECPSVQLERNRYLLEDWFHARNLSIPIKTAVVFPNPRQIIENTRPDLTILFPNEVPSVLRKREFTSPLIKSKTLSHVSNELVKNHADYNPYPMCNTFRINSEEIKSGVQCEKCGTFGMQRINRGWGCNTCRHISKTAHIQAIRDWYMLISDTMTNRECRDFLHISMNYTATRLMGDLPLQPEGVNRGSYYRFPLNKIR